VQSRTDLLKLTGLLIISLALSACTTLRTHEQRVKLATDPPGAQVIYNGQVLGNTPGYFEIPRKSKGSIFFKKAGYNLVERELETSYRWGDSFFSNFVWFFWGAPIGWGVDLISKTAWNYENVSPVKLGGGPPSPPSQSKRVIAVAPPQADSEYLSDALAPAISHLTVKRFINDQVKLYDETWSTFTAYGYSHAEKTSPRYTNDLYYELGITHMLESQSERGKDGVHVTARLYDIYQEKDSEAFSQTIPYSLLGSTREKSFKESLYSILTLIPNSVTFDATTPNANIKVQSAIPNDSFVARPDTSNTLLSFISSFGFRNAKDPRLMNRLRVTFRLVPELAFNYNRFQFERTTAPNSLQNYSFDWYIAIAGIGPELGLESTIGYFSFGFIPVFAQNWIVGQGAGRETSITRGDLAFEGEVAYTVFVARRFYLRLFARSLTVPNSAWEQVLKDLSGQALTVESANRGVGGLSIGYYFPEGKGLVKSGFSR
jgi:hypothetical protein